MSDKCERAWQGVIATEPRHLGQDTDIGLLVALRPPPIPAVCEPRGGGRRSLECGSGSLTRPSPGFRLMCFAEEAILQACLEVQHMPFGFRHVFGQNGRCCYSVAATHRGDQVALVLDAG